VDAYLKENERDNISALMIAGGWVEGLYIATQVTLTNDNPALRQRIAEQRYSLDDLVSLIDTYGSDDETLLAVRDDLASLQALFNDIPAETGGASSVTQENGVTVIGGDAPPVALNDAQLNAIRDKAAAIRNNYIN
jgi:hypothetical protein